MNYLVFEIYNQDYCVSMFKVKEIINMKKITRIPLFPEYIQGLINIKGEIIPVINLGKRFGYNGEIRQFSKIIIINEEKPFGIIVDKTKGILNEIEEKIESKSTYINSILKKKNKDYILLDIEKLIDIKKTNTNTINISKDRRIIKKLSKKANKKVIIFGINNEKYGFIINEIQEIIKYITPNKIPKMPQCVKGIISIKNEFMPVIDLNECLYGKETIITDFTKIIIMNVNGIKAGFIVDNVYYLLSFPEIKKIPSILRENKKFQGFLRYKDMSIMILNPGFMISDDIKKLNKKSKKIKSDIRIKEKREKYVLFDVENEKYAIEINSIVEINRIKDITRIPEVPDYIRGFMNLRGEIIPLIDLKKRFGINKEIKITEISRMIVVSIEGKKIGFLVDSVTEIIQMNFVEFKSENEFVKGAGEYNGESILILDLKKVLNKIELININKNISNKSKIKNRGDHYFY
ncbi:chemotaxis protein CheW [Marinitoga lauensis]|uniref:chemotaxis protein CheW n=1 Tax=Marinitoga lauensis TaxID=2201189 RepID=UPI0014051E12|nr:chemotaxis protein CheW [Marinitoga lauensis]